MAKYEDAEFAAWAAETFDWKQDPELVWLPMDTPMSVFEAQRTLDEQRASGMSTCLIPSVAAGVMVALPPDGVRICLDGQHRWHAALLAGAAGLWALQYRWSEQQAAAAFELKNGRAVLISTHLDQLRAKHVADYAPSNGVYAVLDRYSMDLATDRNRRPNQIAASTIAEAIWEVDEGVLLDRTLSLIQAAFVKDGEVPGEALLGDMLTSVALFLAHFPDYLPAARLREFTGRLMRNGIDKLIGSAREPWREHRQAPLSVYLEQQLVKLHNYDRQDHLRIPERTVRELRRELPSLKQLVALSKEDRQNKRAAS